MRKIKQLASGPLTQQEIRVNMKTFAAFMARMIEKYVAAVFKSKIH